jgi:hypothetical protein
MLKQRLIDSFALKNRELLVQLRSMLSVKYVNKKQLIGAE